MYRRNMSGKLKKVVMYFIRLSILLLLSRPKLTVCCESQFLLDSRFLISVQIENRVEDQVSWDRKQKFDPWLQDFLIISHRHNTTLHGLFMWETRILKQDQAKQISLLVRIKLHFLKYSFKSFLQMQTNDSGLIWPLGHDKIHECL